MRKTSSRRQREKFHLEEVCSRPWGSAANGKWKEMINEIAGMGLNLHSQVPDFSHRVYVTVET